MNEMIVTLTGPATILGYGNGDPGFKEIERPVMVKHLSASRLFLEKHR